MNRCFLASCRTVRRKLARYVPPPETLFFMARNERPSVIKVDAPRQAICLARGAGGNAPLHTGTALHALTSGALPPIPPQLVIYRQDTFTNQAI